MIGPTPAAAYASATVEAARDGDLRLELDRVDALDGSRWSVPAYRFAMVARDARAGTVSLRVGDHERLVRYAGQVGFAVDPPFRGQRLAERATRLLLPLARVHGLDPLWITCNPDNVASIRTLERLGAEFVEKMALPSDYDRYAAGERVKLRYRLTL